MISGSAATPNDCGSQMEQEVLLTSQQVWFFRHNGFLRLPCRLDRDQVEYLKDRIYRHIRDGIPPLRADESGRVVRLSRFIDRDPAFLEIFSTPQITGSLEALLGPNIVLLGNRHNHATINRPGIGSHRLHRDVLQWSRTIISVMAFLDDSSYADGCTHVIPGSHLLPFVGTPNNGGCWMDEHQIFADLMDQAVAVPMTEGSLLAFDGVVFHGAGVNTRDSDRLAITLAYRSVDELSGLGEGDEVLVRGQYLYRGSQP